MNLNYSLKEAESIIANFIKSGRETELAGFLNYKFHSATDGKLHSIRCAAPDEVKYNGQAGHVSDLFNGECKLCTDCFDELMATGFSSHADSYFGYALKKAELLDISIQIDETSSVEQLVQAYLKVITSAKEDEIFSDLYADLFKEVNRKSLETEISNLLLNRHSDELIQIVHSGLTQTLKPALEGPIGPGAHFLYQPDYFSVLRYFSYQISATKFGDLVALLRLIVEKGKVDRGGVFLVPNLIAEIFYRFDEDSDILPAGSLKDESQEFIAFFNSCFRGQVTTIKEVKNSYQHL